MVHLDRMILVFEFGFGFLNSNIFFGYFKKCREFGFKIKGFEIKFINLKFKSKFKFKFSNTT